MSALIKHKPCRLSSVQIPVTISICTFLNNAETHYHEVTITTEVPITMESNRTISIPSGDIAPAFPHRMPAEGIRMNVKHTHPTYTDSAQRTERLRDLKKTCVGLVQEQRKKVASA